ncbi:MAG: hypothetical protein JKY67_11830 [Pseudomonadales bacterium]|nr:hypothetical protein [Pseudomonadales bacterium]
MLTTKPSLYKVQFTDGIPMGVQFVLNSTDVTDQFTITQQGAEVDGALLAQYVFSGKNEFSARAGLELQLSVFYYDDTGPTVHVLNADHSAGTVSGYLDDPSGVVSLTINGTNIDVDAQNRFSSSFTSLPYNEFVATDANGYQSATTFARGDQQLFPSMSLRLTNDGFAFLGDQLATGLSDFNFSGAMEAINPIYNGLIYELSLSNFHFTRPVIDLVVKDDESFHIRIEIPNFIASMKLDKLFGSTEGTMTVDNVIIETDAMIDIVDSDISLSIANTALILDNLVIDLDSTFYTTVLGSLANWLLPKFIAVIEQLAVPILSDFIGGLLIEGDITLEDNDVIETIRLLVTPTYLDTFSNGLTVDINAALSAPDPSPAAPDQIGSLYVMSDLPSLQDVTPDGSHYDVGISLSANLINQALYAAHESGITTMRITPANTAGVDPEGVSVIQGEGDDIQVLDSFALRLEPASPLFVSLMQGDNLHGLLGWYDVYLGFDVKRASWSDYKNIFSVKFSLEVPFELGATENGSLHIGIEQLPVIEVLDTVNIGPIKLSQQFVNDLVEHVMPVVLPTLSGALDILPLPTIGGYRIHADELWVSGDNDRNFSLAGSLVKEITTEQSTAPTSSLTTTTSNVGDVVNAEVTIDVNETLNPTNAPLEYRYRVDGGGWSNWKQRSSIRMRRLLGGHHKVEVCSRTILMKQEVDCPTAEFETVVAQ